MNIQYAVKKEDGRPGVYVLEVNPRASRTVPFVSKATGMPLAKVAAKVMVGRLAGRAGVSPASRSPPTSRSKKAVFPFVKFAGVDIVLGPEMKSTGEVMGISDAVFDRLRQEPTGRRHRAARPSGKIFISVADRAKPHVVDLARRLEKMGYRTAGHQGHGAAAGRGRHRVQRVKKLQQGHPNLLDYMLDGDLQLVINTPSGKGARTDEGRIRAAAVVARRPLHHHDASGRRRRPRHGSHARRRDDRPGRAGPLPELREIGNAEDLSRPVVHHDQGVSKSQSRVVPPVTLPAGRTPSDRPVPGRWVRLVGADFRFLRGEKMPFSAPHAPLLRKLH